MKLNIWRCSKCGEICDSDEIDGTLSDCCRAEINYSIGPPSPEMLAMMRDAKDATNPLVVRVDAEGEITSIFEIPPPRS